MSVGSGTKKIEEAEVICSQEGSSGADVNY